MRINVGRHWTDYGPGSASGGLVGHRSAQTIALSEPLSPDRRSSSGDLRCPICQEPTAGGRKFCSTEHAKLGWGDR